MLVTGGGGSTGRSYLAAERKSGGGNVEICKRIW